jgi:hypothetical protein
MIPKINARFRKMNGRVAAICRWKKSIPPRLVRFYAS